MTISPPKHNPHMIFSVVKDADNIFYSAKNQVHGLCVDADMVILFFSDVFDADSLIPKKCKNEKKENL